MEFTGILSREVQQQVQESNIGRLKKKDVELRLYLRCVDKKEGIRLGAVAHTTNPCT